MGGGGGGGGVDDYITFSQEQYLRGHTKSSAVTHYLHCNVYWGDKIVFCLGLGGGGGVWRKF